MQNHTVQDSTISTTEPVAPLQTQIDLPEPSNICRATVQNAAKITRNRSAPVRRGFIRRLVEDADGPRPPLARLVGSNAGRGGDVRLKLYLSILWFASGEGHDVDKPARAWAQLIDLEDPSTNGARRVTSAIKRLQEESLIRVETASGMPSRIVLLEETGSGNPYRYPARSLEQLKDVDRGEPEKEQHFFLQLSHRFWTDYWVTVLSSAELTCLLALGMECRDWNKWHTRVTIAPSIWASRYAVSDDLRSKGFLALQKRGLVQIGRTSVDKTPDFGLVKVRNTYQLTPTGKRLFKFKA